MKKLILFTLIFWASQVVFAQNYKIIDANNNDFSNDTIVVVMDADKVNSDDAADYGMILRFLNNGMTDDSVRLQIKEIHLSANADISYCCDAGCYTKTNTESDKFLVKSKDTSSLHLDYLPHKTMDTAWVVYRVYEDGSRITQEVEVTVLYVIATGINNVKKQNTFVAYPNPANQMVKVNYSVQESAQISLYDIVGNKVKEINLSPNNKVIQINTAELPAGTYFYTLTTTKATKTKRLIIRH